MTDRWTAAQLSGTIRWVLSLEYAGGTWYLTDEAMTISDGAGGSVVLTDGLLDTSGTEETLDLWSTDSPRRSVGVEFDLGVDVAALVELGHELAGCVAELAQLADGDAWTDRRPFARGLLVEPQYGADGEPVRASIEQDVLSSEATIEAVTTTRNRIMDAIQDTLGYTTTYLPPNNDDDLSVPIIIGVPCAGETPGSRAYYCGSLTIPPFVPRDVYVIAGHAVSATTVTLVNRDDQSEVTLPVARVTLLTGHVVSYVLDDTTLALWTPTQTPVVRWDGGGGYVDEGPGVLESAGDLLAWLLTGTEQELDHARVDAAREGLRAFRLGTYIDESVTIADYLRESVLDALPVSLVCGPRGVYPYVWHWDATADDAVCAWDVTTDLDIARDGVVTYEDADKVVNALQLRYRWGAVAEDYTREIWAVGDPALRPRGIRFGGGSNDELTRSYWADPVLARSVGRYGVRRGALESAVVGDTLTAEHVLAWRSRRYALPSRVVSYSTSQSWGWVEPGDLVTVTDPDLAWVGKLCLVQSRTWGSDGTVGYVLRVQEV